MSRRRRAPHARWQQWQASPQVQRTLTPEQQQHGLTVARVHPACRDAFLDVVRLLNAWGKLAGQPEASQALRQAWSQWLDATCLLRAQCEAAREETKHALP